MPTLSVTIGGDVLGLVAAEQRLKHIPGATDKAIKRAAARTALRGTTGILKQITKTSNIKSAISKERIKKGKAGKLGQFVKLERSGRLGVRHFKAKFDETGVKYQIGKKDKWLHVPRAFSGPPVKLTADGVTKKGKVKVKRHVVHYIKWRGNGAVRKGKSRLPIVFVKGVSPIGWFTIKKLRRPTKFDLREFFNERLRHEIKFILNQKKGT